MITQIRDGLCYVVNFFAIRLTFQTRRHWGVKRLVHALEQAVIDYLASLEITAQRRDTAPGVYVAERKIAALGLRVQRGCCYHGLSLNVDMDLHPFDGINPGENRVRIALVATLQECVEAAQRIQSVITSMG